MKGKYKIPRRKKRYFRRNPPLTRSHTWTWTLQDHYHYQNDPQAPGPPAPVCAPYIDGVHSYPSLVGIDTVTYGANIPMWRQAIANHVSATTSLTGLKYVANIPIGTARSDGTTWACQHSYTVGPITGQFLFWNTPGGGGDTGADNQAKSKLLGSYLDARNTWRGGNFFAEILETIHMLRHPLKSLYRSTWDFAGKVRQLGKVYVKRRDYAKHLADAWLGYSFGVKPLIEDINDATKAYNKLLDGFGSDAIPIKGAGRRTVVTHNTSTAASPFLYLGDTFDCRVLGRIQYKVRYHGAIIAGPEDGTRALEEFGLSLDDIVPAVWEAIPWSFFIDYFLNVQEILDSMRYGKAGVAWLESNVRNAGTVNVFPPIRRGHTTPTNSDMSCGMAYSLVVRVGRAQLGALPYPDWHFKVPKFPSLKWLNITALAKEISTSKPVTPRTGRKGYHLYN